MGRVATPFSAGYCMSKFGVEAFSDILRLEMKKFNVQVKKTGVETKKKFQLNFKIDYFQVIIIEPGNFATATQLTIPNGLFDQSQLCRQFWDQMDGSLRNDYGKSSLEEVITTSDITKQIAVHFATYILYPQFIF